MGNIWSKPGMSYGRLAAERHCDPMKKSEVIATDGIKLVVERLDTENRRENE